MWREGLLALKALPGNTRGYSNHPQLDRFKQQADPLAAISAYLREVHNEASRRGYRFDAGKICVVRKAPRMRVTAGQIAYEFAHLKAKLKVRNPDAYLKIAAIETPRPHPLDHKNVTNRVWYPLLRHLGIEKRRPYQCRHTAATLWLAAGENPEWIAHQMGHTTTEMLFRVYSRFVPNLTRQDGSAFERLLMQNGAADAKPINPLAVPAPHQAESGTAKEQAAEVSHVQ